MALYRLCSSEVERQKAMRRRRSEAWCRVPHRSSDVENQDEDVTRVAPLRKRKKVERFDVACLRERKDENREDLETRKSFQEAVRTRLQEPQMDSREVEEKWEMIESALTKVS